MADETIPEILRANMGSAVLHLKVYSVVWCVCLCGVVWCCVVWCCVVYCVMYDMIYNRIL